MTDHAAVIRRAGDAFDVVPVVLPPIEADEIRVRIVATGMCHTDLMVRAGGIPLVPMPAILGHEGAGIVAEVGSDVSDFATGDHVVLSFAFCGDCRHCIAGRPADCDRLFPANFLGGEARALCGDGTHLNGGFFNQSSFATHSIVKARHAVRVPDHIPLELLAPLGCGVITGAGTVLNHMRATPGSSIVIFGTGAVGLSAVMAAKLAGCATIIAIDVHAARLDLAAELGATHGFQAQGGGIRDKVRALLPAGTDFVLDTSGVPLAIADALACVGRRGSVVLVGGKPGDTITLDMGMLLSGASIQMVAEGASVPRTFIPFLIEQFEAGRFPIDRLIQFYDFQDINLAAHDAEVGTAIKPVLRMRGNVLEEAA